MDIKEHDFAIRIAFMFWNEEKNKEEKKAIIFQNAKVISWNKCRRSGHLPRMNKKINAYQYGYGEFYTDNGNKYISIIKSFPIKRTIAK